MGMATNIPPHNLREVAEGLLAVIENPEITVDELMTYIKGPDFPTYGQIHGVAGIKEAYMTGRGSVVMRARAFVEEMGKSGKERIVVTEIPYQVNKARLIEKIADLVREKKIEGITDLRDESAGEGIRVVIELRKGEIADIILNNLFKMTPMQTSFGVNVVALVNGAPRILNLKNMLELFYRHRREVVVRKTAYELRQAEERGHILEGLKIAVENIDEVVSTIRKAPDALVAHEQLKVKFTLSDIQAKAILEMRLSRLTGLERDKIVEEYNATLAVIADLKNILDTPSRVTDIVKTGIITMRDKFGDDRRTEIIGSAADVLTMEHLVADEEVAVAITHAGYVKRTPITDIRAQRRGGKGKSGMLTKEEDVVKDLFITSNHQSILCFSNFGKVYDIKVYQIPEAPLRARGKHFANLIKMEDGERVVSVLTVKEFVEGKYILTATAMGYVKKTDLMAYSNMRTSGIIGLKLEDDDTLVSCAITDGKSDVLLATKLGKAIRFNEEECRPMGRASRGVTGIRFSEEKDVVIGMEVISGDSTILSVCENGFGKRSPLDEYRSQTRGGKGIYTIKVNERNGGVVGIAQVCDTDDLMIMTSSGKLMRFTVGEIGVIGRLTQGVRLMAVDEGEHVISLCKVQQFEGEEL